MLLLVLLASNAISAMETDLMQMLSNTSTLQIKYGRKMVENGNALTPTEVKIEPSVNWNHEDDYYALAMTDIDVLFKKQRQQLLHWLVVNIRGDAVQHGDVICEYLGAGPPKDDGYHRYLFLVYKQSGNLTFGEEFISGKSMKGRIDFDILRFSQKYQFGDAEFGNYFQAKYDDYVPELRKQLVA